MFDNYRNVTKFIQLFLLIGVVFINMEPFKSNPYCVQIGRLAIVSYLVYFVYTYVIKRKSKRK